MLGIGWSEMLVIAVVVLIVVGPKDLPMMLRNIGRAVGTVQRMGNEFRRELDKTIAADELREAQKLISDPLKQTSDQIRREFNSIREDGKVEPSGKIKPSQPGKESVADEIRAQAGLPPAAPTQTEPKAPVAVRAASQPPKAAKTEPETTSSPAAPEEVVKAPSKPRAARKPKAAKVDGAEN